MISERKESGAAIFKPQSHPNTLHRSWQEQLQIVTQTYDLIFLIFNKIGSLGNNLARNYLTCFARLKLAPKNEATAGATVLNCRVED